MLETVDDLRAELRERDLEFEQMRKRVQQLEKDKVQIAKELLIEKGKNSTVNAKLNKIQIMR
jgi:cell shape-determining protein MreC